MRTKTCHHWVVWYEWCSHGTKIMPTPNIFHSKDYCLWEGWRVQSINFCGCFEFDFPTIVWACLIHLMDHDLNMLHQKCVNIILHLWKCKFLWVELYICKDYPNICFLLSRFINDCLFNRRLNKARFFSFNIWRFISQNLLF